MNDFETYMILDILKSNDDQINKFLDDLDITDIEHRKSIMELAKNTINFINENSDKLSELHPLRDLTNDFINKWFKGDKK